MRVLRAVLPRSETAILVSGFLRGIKVTVALGQSPEDL